MTIERFMLAVPFEEQCRWQMLGAALKSDVPLDRAAKSIERKPAHLWAALAGKRELRMSDVADWAWAFGCRAKFDLFAMEDA